MPVNFACTDAQREQVRVLLELGVGAKKVGPMCKPAVSYSTVLRIKKNLHHYGTPIAPRAVMGRTLKINHEMAQVKLKKNSWDVVGGGC
jgi:hypothetical protein